MVLWNYESEDYMTRFCSDTPSPNLGGLEGLSQEDGESRLRDLHRCSKELDFIPVGKEELLTYAVALNKIRARALRIMKNTEGSKEMSVGRMKKRMRHKIFTGMPSRATHR